MRENLSSWWNAGGSFFQPGRAAHNTDGGIGKAQLQIRCGGRIIQTDKLRKEFSGLRLDFFHAGPGRKSGYAVIPKLPDDVKRLGSDAAGRADDTDLFHSICLSGNLKSAAYYIRCGKDKQDACRIAL